MESEATGATAPPPLPPAVETDSPVPPRPPAALEDDFDDFELSDDLDVGGSDIFEAPDFQGQGGRDDAPINDIAPPPPAGVEQTPVTSVSADDFDFNFGGSDSTSSAQVAPSSPLGDLFDDLDDLPAPKQQTKEDHYTDLPAPRSASSAVDFSEVSDLPGLKTQRAPIGAPQSDHQQSGAEPELLLAPEDVGTAPELPNDEDAHFLRQRELKFKIRQQQLPSLLRHHPVNPSGSL